MREKALRWQNWVRQQEFDAVKPWLKQKLVDQARVLEVGGGNGLLAGRLAEMGFDVISIDPEPREPSYFPVARGDCTRLEFEDGAFDVIFSSNVLEHVDDLGAALAEMRRVLKEGGIMVHTMPTHYATIFTLLVQPVGYFIKIGLMISYGFKFAAFALAGAVKLSTAGSTAAKGSRRHPQLNKRNIKDAVKMANPVRLFISWPHGTSPNCFTELRDWKPQAWCRRFEQAGFKVQAVLAMPLAYSRHAVLPFRFVKIRRRLAENSKSACAAYLIQC